MGQWVQLGVFRTFISTFVLKGLACEFGPRLDEGGSGEQNLYTTRALCIEGSGEHTRSVKALPIDRLLAALSCLKTSN
jgi:hypothetical protein